MSRSVLIALATLLIGCRSVMFRLLVDTGLLVTSSSVLTVVDSEGVLSLVAGLASLSGLVDCGLSWLARLTI